MTKRFQVAMGVVGVCSLGCGGPSAEPAVGETVEAVSEGGNQGADWPFASHDALGTSFASDEKDLNTRTARNLRVEWVFDEAAAGAPVGAIHATPVVSRGRTYVGSFSGTFYAIGSDGGLLWSFVTAPTNPVLGAFVPGPAPVVAGAALSPSEDTVVFGDIGGNVYKLDRATGAEIWRKSVDPNAFGGIWGGLLVVGDTVFVPLSAFETLAPFYPGYTCCSHRGGVVALNLVTGAEKWRYESITAAEQGPLPPELGPVETFGPSGGDVWVQPTFDADSNTLYFGTGQLFSRKADGTGPGTYDAVVAVDASTGTMKWVRQFSSSLDVYRFDTPTPDPVTGVFVDRDISGQVKIYAQKRNGRKVVGVGQKNGEFHVLDAATGEVITTNALLTQAAPEGGFQTGGAVAGDTVFEHGITTASSPGAPYDGKLLGLSLDGTGVKWSFTRPASPLFGGVSVASGVAYIQSPFEENVNAPGSPATWALYAVDAGSGAVLDRVVFENARAMNAPVVSRGHVYAGFGSILAHGLTTPNATGGVICFGSAGN